MKLISYIAAAVLLSLSTGGQAATQVSDKLKQNLEIMRDILQKSMEQPGRSSGVGRIELSYLAGQGVLFQTRTAGGFGRFFAVAPAAPIPPVAPISPPDLAAITDHAHAVAQAALAGHAVDEDQLQEMAEQAELAAEQMMEQHELMRDQSRELREQKRDLERDLRDVQRDKRDIEFRAKVDKLDAEQQKQLQQLSTREAALAKQVKDMQQKYDAAEQEMLKKRQEQAKIAQQKQTELIAQVGSKFAATLCDYGASLRELKDNEFVSLQLSTDGGRDSRDIYWVFKKSDINQCISGKVGAEALLKKADYYQY
ncbi:MAG: hypothetical protein E6Q75_10835 [Rheinheimera sp.]|nr:MAG: hypothetical protein E6Q75_10835 [Rheinheimera sp.]